MRPRSAPCSAATIQGATNRCRSCAPRWLYTAARESTRMPRRSSIPAPGESGQCLEQTKPLFGTKSTRLSWCWRCDQLRRCRRALHPPFHPTQRDREHFGPRWLLMCPPSRIVSALSLLGLSSRVYVMVASVSWHSSNYDLARCGGRSREVHHTHTHEHQRLTVFVRSVITF